MKSFEQPSLIQPRLLHVNESPFVRTTVLEVVG